MATIARSSIVRSEPSVSWLPDESFEELSFDAGFLVVCLLIFLFVQHGKRKPKAHHDPPSDVPVPDKPVASQIKHHPLCSTTPILSQEKLVLAMLQRDDRQPSKVIETYRQCRERIDWNKITGDEP